MPIYRTNSGQLLNTWNIPVGDATPPVMGVVTVDTITQNSFEVSWVAATDNVAVSHYEIRINGGNVVNIGNVLTYSSGTLVAGQNYEFEIRAVDTSGNTSAWINEGIQLSSDTIPPSAISNPSVNVAISNVTVSFTHATDNVAVTGYQWQDAIDQVPVDLPYNNSFTLTTYPNDGNNYIIQVRARDAAGNFGVWTDIDFTTVQANNAIFSAMNNAVIEHAQSNLDGSFSYIDSYGNYGSTPGADTLVANQQVDGFWADQQPFSFTDPNNRSDLRGAQYHTESNLRARLRKVAEAYYNTGNTTYFDAAMENLKWIADEVVTPGFWNGNRATWTPAKVWMVEALAYCMAFLAEGIRNNLSTTYRGETVESIVNRIMRRLSGLDTNWDAVYTDDTAVPYVNMTGSADNETGANRVQIEASQIELCSAIAYITDNDSGLVAAINRMNTAFYAAWGKFYLVSADDQWQDWVGFGPRGSFGAHNDSGRQSQLTRYLYTQLNNMRRVEEVFATSSGLYRLDPNGYELLTQGLENAVVDLLRRDNVGFRAGRQFTTYSEISGGAFSIRIGEFLTACAYLTQDQRTRLQRVEFLCGGDNRPADIRRARYYWDTGRMIVVGTNDSNVTSFYVGFATGRTSLPDQYGPAVAAIEQSAGIEYNYNSFDGLWINTDQGQTTQDSARDWMNTRNLRANWPTYGIDGTIAPNATPIAPMNTASSPNTQNNNTKYSGADLDDLYVISGHELDRERWNTAQYDHTVAIWLETNLPGYTPSMAVELDLYNNVRVNADVTESSGADLCLNIVENQTDPITYFDGSERTLTTTGTLPSSQNITNYWHWVPYGPNSSFGHAVLLLGTNELNFARAGATFRAFVNLGTTPANLDFVRIRLYNATLADTRSFVNNYLTLLNWTNTSDVQGGILSTPSPIAQYNIFTPSQVSIGNGDSITVDEPCSIITIPHEGAHRVGYAWGAWWDIDDSTPLGVNINKNSQTPVFAEWWKSQINIDRSGPGRSRPVGTYYGGGTNEILL